MASPLVSVVMPVHDGERFVEQAVRSILGQTFADLELIVVDDGSTDGTPTILDRLAESDARMRVLPTEWAGVVAAANEGCAHARGEYIARMDSDDVSMPERLERQLARLETDPSLLGVGSWVRYVDERGEPFGEWRTPQGPGLVAWSLLLGMALAHPSFVMRRDAFERAGGYSAVAPHAEDYDLLLRLAELGSLDNLPTLLADRRVHGRSISDRNSAEQEDSAAELTARSLSRLLEEPVSRERARALRATLQAPHEADPAALRDAERLVRASLSAYIRSAALDRDERRTVRADAASRLELLARGAWRVERRLALELAGASLGVRFLART